MTFFSSRVIDIILVSKMFGKLLKIFMNPKRILLYFSKRREDYSQKQLNSLWSNQEYILNQVELFSPEFLEKNKKIREIEHQVGRYLI